MSKGNLNGPEGRETIGDPVTELLRVGAQQLIQQAVEAELAERLSQHGDRRTETGNAGVVRNGYLPERELQTGLGPVTVQIPKVRAKTGEACDVPIGAGTALHSEDEVAGSSGAVVVFQRRLQRRDGGRPKSSCRSPCAGTVGEYGIAIETVLGRAVPPWKRGAFGCRSLGLCLGRRHLQRTSGGTKQVVRIGRDRRE